MVVSSLPFMNDQKKSKGKFFKNLYIVLVGLSELSQNMEKNRPQVTKLTDSLISIHNGKKNVLNSFEEIIKKEEVSYACVELYFKFVKCFMDQGSVNNEMIERLKRIKIKSERDDIDEIHMPAFLVEADTNIIEQFNSQAVKFMRCSRTDIKFKNFSSFIVPAIKVSTLYELIEKNQDYAEKFPLFFYESKGSEPDLVRCMNITISVKMLKNRKYYVVCAQKRSYNVNSIEVLLNSEQELIATTHSEIVLEDLQNNRIPCEFQ